MPARRTYLLTYLINIPMGAPSPMFDLCPGLTRTIICGGGVVAAAAGVFLGFFALTSMRSSAILRRIRVRSSASASARDCRAFGRELDAGTLGRRLRRLAREGTTVSRGSFGGERLHGAIHRALLVRARRHGGRNQ